MWPDLERRLRLRLRTGSPVASVTSGRRVSPLPTEELAFAEAARDGFPRLRLPLPERGTDCPSLRPAADAPETDGCSPLSGSLTCLSIAPRGTIAARGALLIFVGWTLPAPSQIAKFFLHTVQVPAEHRPTTQLSQPLQEFLPGAADFLPKSIASPDLLFISPPHRLGTHIAHAVLGNRLTVDPRTLTPLVLVRIQVPQPNSKTKLSCTDNGDLIH